MWDLYEVLERVIMKNKPSKEQIVSDDETETMQIVEEKSLEDLEVKIGKLLKNQPPPTIGFHEFKKNFRLPFGGINPHRIRSKDFVEVDLRKVFKVARGSSGYNSFVDYHDLLVLDKIRYIYPIIYGKDDVPKSKLIGKEFPRGIILEVVKGKLVSQVGFGHEINANQQSKWLSWMEKCLEKKGSLLGPKNVTQLKIESYCGIDEIREKSKKRSS